MEVRGISTVLMAVHTVVGVPSEDNCVSRL